jgi:arabinogalactan oligomer/maltooligosaccharide transport system permease protein
MSALQKVSLPRMIITHMVMWVACIIAIFPFLRVVAVSIRPGNNLFSTEFSIIPPAWSLENYYLLFTERQFLQWVFNSIVITSTTALLGVVLAATAAYAFSRYKFPGRMAGLSFLLVTQMIPGTMLILPQYLIMAKANMLDTYMGLIIAYSVSTLPFSVWILKGYFDTIPRSLEEAAFVDGCSEMASFYRIVLPLSKPALAIVFLFNFMSSWNEVLVAYTVLGKPEMKTWPLGLMELQAGFNVAWGQFAAGSVLISIPTILLFFLSSKYMMSGLTLGSVKG